MRKPPCPAESRPALKQISSVKVASGSGETQSAAAPYLTSNLALKP
ncbi:MAG: hypothetical protein OJF48_000700 [Afipia sp.]|nr:MAG: hypothetical protein OJF48_000700 [Afipia sp.]